MKKIVTVFGDYYHDHDQVLSTFQRAVSSGSLGAELHDIAIERLSAELSEHPDLLVIDKEDRLNPADERVDHWMTPEIGRRIADYVADGGGILAWHSGLASYPEQGPYAELLKGSFKFHPHVNKPVRYFSRKNDFLPVSVSDFEAIDEHYFVECDLEHTNVFLTSESADGASMAGWAHFYGKGRVCCLAPTHRTEGLTHPEMENLLRQCVQWCLI